MSHTCSTVTGNLLKQPKQGQLLNTNQFWELVLTMKLPQNSEDFFSPKSEFKRINPLFNH